MVGIYFTSSREGAMEWGARRPNSSVPSVFEAYIKILRPADTTCFYGDDPHQILHENPARMTKCLIGKGFDGYIDQSNSEDALEVVAFSSEQVRVCSKDSNQ